MSRPSRWLGRGRAAMIWGAAAAATVLALAFCHGRRASAEDVPWRVAQINIDNFKPVRADGQQPETNTHVATLVVISFLASTPDSVADEVASQYRLESVTRFLSVLLGRRVVLYRVIGERDVNHLIAVLQSDARVASVQLNREYLVLPKGTPPAPVARLPERTPAQGRHASPRPAHARSDIAAGTREPARASPRNARADGTAAAPSAPGGQRRSAALGSDLRWPTADEPFVGPTAR